MAATLSAPCRRRHEILWNPHPPHRLLAYAAPVERTTGFTQVGPARVAYQVIGDGPVDLVVSPGSFVSFDIMDEDPLGALYYARLASIARVIRFDRRGAGSSDPVSLEAVPGVESYVDETLAVMDTAGSERAVVMVGYDAGPMAITLAATHPDRVAALILMNTTSRFLHADDYPIGIDPEAAEQIATVFAETWGTEMGAALSVPSRADDPQFLSWFAKMQRLTITPTQAASYVRALIAVDVRSMLLSVQAPTLVIHRADFAFIPMSHGEFIAEHIPGARFVSAPGGDGALVWEAQDEILAAIEEFVTDTAPAPGASRVVTTVVFADIVDSTNHAEKIGDRRWLALLEVYDDLTAKAVNAHGGRVVKHTGDGFMATFDSPGRALQCTTRLRRDLGQLGIETRFGIHTGEAVVTGTEVGGIAVHLASRVMSQAAPGEIVVSSVVKDLAVGSEHAFEDRGRHTLKGFDEPWQLFAVRVT